MKEVEAPFWFFVAWFAFIGVACIVSGLIYDWFQYRRIRRIFGTKDKRKDKS